MKRFAVNMLVLGIAVGIFFIIRYFLKKEEAKKEAGSTGTMKPGTIVGQPISETEQAIEQSVVLPDPKSMQSTGVGQTFVCNKTGESITTNNYQEYVNFVGKCQKAGGNIDQKWNFNVQAEQILRNDLGMVDDEIDISDIAYYQLR
jgi:hypothetical protein